MLNGEIVDHAEIGKVLAKFDELWATMAPPDKSRVLELLVDKLDYDGRNGPFRSPFFPAASDR